MNKKLLPLHLCVSLIGQFKTQLNTMEVGDAHHDRDETKPFYLGPVTYPIRQIVVMIHGFTSHTDAMKPFAERLSQKNPHALVVGMPLTGHSTAQLPQSAQHNQYTTYARSFGFFLNDLHHAYPHIPIHMIGCSAGATMVESVLQNTPSGTLKTAHQLAPYYNPASRVGKIILGSAYWVTALQHPLGNINKPVTADPRVPHFFKSTLGHLSALHQFSWETWNALHTTHSTHRTIYITPTDTVICNDTARNAATRMGASVEEHLDMNHNMFCSVRNTSAQHDALIESISKKF